MKIERPILILSLLITIWMCAESRRAAMCLAEDRAGMFRVTAGLRE